LEGVALRLVVPPWIYSAWPSMKVEPIPQLGVGSYAVVNDVRKIMGAIILKRRRRYEENMAFGLRIIM
jgi:hypothetical protein